MSVLINFKICDNAKECGGVEVCPTGALTWDELKETIVIDNLKCISCGKCESACGIGAIKVAKSDLEYQKINSEFEADPRKIADLFVDRYGACPINEAWIIPDNGFNKYVLESNKLTVVEFFSDESIECLRFSIPIKELFENIDIKYRRFKVKDTNLTEKYAIKQLPSLLFFQQGKLIGKIEGYYYQKDKNKLIKKVKEIILGI